MNLQKNSDCSCVSVIKKPETLAATRSDMITLKNAGNTSLSQYQVKSRPASPERDFHFQRGKSMGTDSKMMARTLPSISDEFLNNQAEKVVRDAIDGLSTLYAFRESYQVEQFLKGNNTLRGMLSTIYSKIRKEFLSEKITLEVVSDSPLSGEKDIVISVSTTLPVDEAIERLDKVEDVRWNKDSKDPYVDICVKLKYL